MDVAHKSRIKSRSDHKTVLELEKGCLMHKS